MLGVQLLTFVLLGQLPGESADPDDLVSQLGASRYADRETASQALVRLGRPALTALRAARGSQDPEIRNRASGLVQRIEGFLLTQPTLIRLDFQRALLTDVVRSLSQQAGFKVALYPEGLPKWKYLRVSLQQPEPVPFWKAIDLLCDAASLEHNPGLHGIAGPREPTFALTDGPLRSPTPNYDHGPFRVSFMGIHYQHDLNYGAPAIGMIGGIGPLNGPARPARAANPTRGRIDPVSSVQFTAQLLVAAEPRLFISQSGALQITEAVDDRGNSLTLRSSGGPVVNRFAGYIGVMNGSVVQLQAQLRRPAIPGETIKKLRGVIPLSISSRGPDPLVVPLDQGSVGKRFANADVELTLDAIRTMPNTPQTLLEISVKASERSNPADNVESDAFGDVYRPDMHRQQLEIVDSRGRLVTWFPSGVDTETSRLTLTLTNSPGSGPLKELRYHTLTRTTLNVPFEFTDIPMP
jgi:hypothetical protein